MRDLSLDVAEGELLVILGPSGCGKTTILRLIAGLERPTSGDVLFDDRRVTRLRPAQRHVGFVFQQPVLYPHLTVHENLAFVLRIRRLSIARRDERIGEVAKLFHIEPLRERRPGAISTGEQQRVALARAVLREPNCLLMDEPLASLDAPLRVELRREIRAAHERLKLTSIFVTHDQQEAFALADRIALLREGEVQQLGTPMDLYQAPVNVFAARFVGAPGMNLIAGRVDRHPSGHAFFTSGQAIRLSLPSTFPLQVEGAATLGFRPEHAMLIDLMTPAGGPNINIEVTIARFEPLGDHALVLATTYDGKMLTVKAHSDVQPPHTRAQIRVPLAALHFFDRDGARIEYAFERERTEVGACD